MQKEKGMEKRETRNVDGQKREKGIEKREKGRGGYQAKETCTQSAPSCHDVERRADKQKERGRGEREREGNTILHVIIPSIRNISHQGHGVHDLLHVHDAEKRGKRRGERGEREIIPFCM
jgi:hypothetical protein